ncbi:MAG: VOC family protein [Hamadaea sp.]|uniref:VOC family protein n=1 Tax=Hamadaea sp. TaxID=2024425 RepID=UPI00184BDCC3|nr:VOC family protein [Hamadaea sp.]NUR69246.1 VOC family protein [Hamadaea sp.]NUT21108.1 VOC family protein [Hamadaea sp.]
MHYSPNAAATAEFYAGLFGWTAAAKNGATVFLLRDLAVAGLAEIPADSGTPDQRPGWLTHISTDDIDATAQQILDAGGSALGPTTEWGPRGRSAVFTDPLGAVVGVWQHGTIPGAAFAGAEVVDEPGAVTWSEVVTRDMDATSAFYGTVFGWTKRIGTATEAHEYYEWISANRVVGGISMMNGGHYPPGTPPHWRTILQVGDCVEVVKRTSELGGRVLAGPVDADIGTAAYIADPTGGTFLVIEPLPELIAALR